MLLEAVPTPWPAMALSVAQRTISVEEYNRFLSSTLYEITYQNEGLKIKGWLAIPPQEETHMPAIIYNRGGSGPKAALTPVSAAATIGLCASWGYVAIASQYRGVGGSDGKEEWGDGDVRDALALLNVLDSLPYVDHNRIGVIGGSRGGVVTFLMLRKTNRFRAAITYGAPTALHETQENSPLRKTILPFLPQNADVEEELRKRSAVLWADQLPFSTPIFLLHGTKDKVVDPMDSLKLALKLQSLQFPYRLLLYEHTGHVLAERRKESNQQMREWMDRFVKNTRKT